MIFNMITIVSCFILGMVFSPAFTIWLNWKGRNRIRPYFIGAACALVIHRLALRAFYYVLMILYSLEAFAEKMKIFYGLINGIGVSLLTVYIIYETLSILNHRGKWTGTLTRNMAFGFGAGWMKAFLVIGTYCISLVKSYFSGGLGWFGFSDCIYLWNLLIESMLYSVLYAGMTLVIEYAIVKGNVLKACLLCFGIHAFIEIELYYLVWKVNLPGIIAELIFLGVVYWLFRHGFYQIRTIQYHKHHRRK